jgi:hypothetical protein
MSGVSFNMFATLGFKKPVVQVRPVAVAPAPVSINSVPKPKTNRGFTIVKVKKN